jgi:hypothetical protein
VADPEFFSKQWAVQVRDALTADPPEQARGGKLQMYWDFFERVKGTYLASWVLWCRDLPAELGEGPACLFVQWDRGTVTDCQVLGPARPPEASYVLGMDYAGWKALHEGYDAQRTVMYRKILLEDGDLLLPMGERGNATRNCAGRFRGNALSCRGVCLAAVVVQVSPPGGGLAGKRAVAGARGR